MIFGRTDPRIKLSGAKFHEEADFDIKNYLAPPKSRKNDEKMISKTKKNKEFFPNRFFDVLGVAQRRERVEL